MPDDVCVASKVEIGAGEARVLGRVNDGVDVSYEERPEARPSVSRLLIDAEMGLGAIEVRDERRAVRFNDFDRDFDRGSAATSTSPAATDANAACRVTPMPARRTPTSRRSWPGWRSS